MVKSTRLNVSGWGRFVHGPHRLKAQGSRLKAIIRSKSSRTPPASIGRSEDALARRKSCPERSLHVRRSGDRYAVSPKSSAFKLSPLQRIILMSKSAPSKFLITGFVALMFGIGVGQSASAQEGLGEQIGARIDRGLDELGDNLRE